MHTPTFSAGFYLAHQICLLSILLLQVCLQMHLLSVEATKVHARFCLHIFRRVLRFV